MDLHQQALQTNGKFFQIPISFSNYCLKTKKYSNCVNINRSAMYILAIYQ